MRSCDRPRQVSILALIEQAPLNMLDEIEKELKSGKYGLDKEFLALALKIVKRNKRKI